MSKVAKLDQKELFIEMRAKEIPFEQISQELGVSKPTLIKWGKELKLEIDNRRAVEWETLQEKHYVSKKKRVEFYGEQLDRFYQELQKRDLSDIPTEKLFEMTMKTLVSLKSEETPIRFKEEGSFEDTIDELNKSYVEWNA